MNLRKEMEAAEWWLEKEEAEELRIHVKALLRERFKLRITVALLVVILVCVIAWQLHKWLQ